MNKHYIKHQPIFELWVETNQKISASHDLISPLIPEFVKANPGVNVHGCSECVIDMLRWYKKGSKPAKSFNERLDEVAEKKIKTKK